MAVLCGVSRRCRPRPQATYCSRPLHPFRRPPSSQENASSQETPDRPVRISESEIPRRRARRAMPPPGMLLRRPGSLGVKALSRHVNARSEADGQPVLLGDPDPYRRFLEERPEPRRDVLSSRRLEGFGTVCDIEVARDPGSERRTHARFSSLQRLVRRHPDRAACSWELNCSP